VSDRAMSREPRHIGELLEEIFEEFEEIISAEIQSPEEDTENDHDNQDNCITPHRQRAVPRAS